ncbi:DUF4389 domain-containing protein [Saccharomonospora sp. NPDC046836]|uniref:DUF4389 domain-containing protein n=1 Tax=Saccharomonospora sp. NPDC046836 TaxID=3156921 RepID=UPI0033F329AF
MTAPTRTYPVHVTGSFEPRLSRWLWLVKWLLAIPHYILLWFLWIAFAVVTIVAFFAILITGSYPRGMFDFNVGVLRWTWRVQFYAYATLGTDRYPPFTLADVPDYPARLDIDYPERLSRGLVLVKWWLLAIPQYIIVGVFIGGWWYYWDYAYARWGGLIGILVLFAAIALLFGGRYPRSMFDLVVGLDRWVVRVGAYAALMTDVYPPFRLDQGGTDPATTEPTAGPPPPQPENPGQNPGQNPGRGGWTAGRIVSVVLGVILGLISMFLLTAASVLLWVNGPGRDEDGYLTVGNRFSTPAYAITSGPVEVTSMSTGWVPVSSNLGDVRIRVLSRTGTPVFVGIASPPVAAGYLSGVQYATVSDTAENGLVVHDGGPPAGPPTTAGPWLAQASGTGIQTVALPAPAGDWTVVIMNADGSPGVSVRAQAGATVPGLGAVGLSVLGIGIVVLAGAEVLIVVAVRRASRVPQPPAERRPEA